MKYIQRGPTTRQRRALSIVEALLASLVTLALVGMIVYSILYGEGQ
jgi:hypothetical protein